MTWTLGVEVGVGLGVGVGVGLGVGVGVGLGVGVAVGVGPPPLLTINLKVLLVIRVSASIEPDMIKLERSVVEVTSRYWTAVPPGCGGMVAEQFTPEPVASIIWEVMKKSVDQRR